MPLLLLIRHSNNDHLQQGRMAGRLPGVHLNERGRAQAAELVRSLADVPIKAIYSSPLERAVETAAPLAQAKGLEIQIRPGLLETDFGDWQGKSYKQIRRRKLWKTLEDKPSLARFPGGESILEQQTRVVNEIRNILSAHQSKDILALVSHADPIKLAVAHYLGLPLENFQRLEVETSSVTVLTIGKKGARLLILNLKPPFHIDVPHT